VYGNDHSPWVQAVLLGLHEKDVSHSLVALPSFIGFVRYGILMPQASFDNGQWQPESPEILEKLGFHAITDEERSALYGAWRGALHRPDNTLTFWRAFSETGDTHPNPVVRGFRNFLRPFTTLYFNLLIRFARAMMSSPEPDEYGTQYLYWEKRLENSGGPFIKGEEPDAVDLLLFGIIQCHASIEVPPVIALRDDPRLFLLREWVGTMQQRFADYPHLYSVRYFSPIFAEREPAGKPDQAIFWAGAIFMLLMWPVTIPLVILLAMRERRRQASTRSR
jgi:hypothetical protein